MKPAILILCLLGAAYANPILHKKTMEMIQHASNSVSDAQFIQRNFVSSLKTGKSETALTSDNTQSSKENVRRGWIYTLKWVHINNNGKVQATSQPEENDIKSTSDASKKSSESSESKEMVVLNTKEEDNSADTSESTENSYSVDGTEYSTSNSSSSSSSSSESTESKNSAADSESRSAECQPEADSQECDSEEDFPQDIGDDGATDPFNGILMPDVTEP
uniref:Secretory calcium-binding phosphoprotein 1 n=1 Tax=Sinocyclocheilus anshuiensis TaxID=1608454 RepID=A0A671S9D7_9TELE